MPARRHSLGLAFGLLVVVASVALRWPGLDQPHWGIDEGVTFTLAQQVVEGDVLYRDAVDHRTPLVPFLKAAVLAVAGDWNVTAVRFVVAVLLGLVAVLLWRIARHEDDEPGGIAAAVVFVIGSALFIGLPDGAAASTAWFLVFFSTLGFWVFVRALRRPGFGAGLPVGLCFGLAALCKQPALLDFGVTWVILALAALTRGGERSPLARLFAGQLLGALLPFAAFAAYFAAHGVWDDFVYYAFTYNTAVYIPAAGEFDRLELMAVPFRLARENMPVIAALAVGGGAGLLIVAFGGLVRRRPLAVLPWLALGWTAAGLVATGLSGRSFAHYSTQALPGLSLAAGWVLGRLFRGSRRPGWLRWPARVALAATIGALGYSAGPRTARFLRLEADWISDGADIGRVIAAQTQPDERIFVWGYFPEYHLVSQRLPATRFVYANFLTGFVPWEDMDALTDTSRWVTPGAWDDFWHDFRANPPALIVDRRQDRAMGKYSLWGHDQIREVLLADYAEVSLAAQAGFCRFYRRLDPRAVPLAHPAGLPEEPDPDLRLTIDWTRRPGEGPSLRLLAGPGWRHFSFWAGDRLVASLPHAADLAAGCRLWQLAERFAPGDQIRVVGERTDGSHAVSPTLDYSSALAAAEQSRGPLPLLRLNGNPTAPIIATTVGDGPTSTYEPEPGAVVLHAPARLVYPCDPSVRRLALIHGLLPHLYELSDGYDIVLNWLPADGAAAQELWRTRLPTRGEGRFRSTQHEEIDLPARGPGQLEFRFLTGPRGDAKYDVLFFGDDPVVFPAPLILADGRTLARAHDNVSDELSRWYANPDAGWILHAPGRAQWDLPSDQVLTGLTLAFGIEAGAYEPGGGQTDGVTFVLLYQGPGDDAPRPLFERHLDPLNNPADRGRQTATVPLPDLVGGVLTLETREGPHGNGAWDWSWIGDSTAETRPLQP